MTILLECTQAHGLGGGRLPFVAVPTWGFGCRMGFRGAGEGSCNRFGQVKKELLFRFAAMEVADGRHAPNTLRDDTDALAGAERRFAPGWPKAAPSPPH